MWTGLPGGTYTLEPLEECPVGTVVILTAKPGMEHYFQPRKVAKLVRYYGLALPVPVYLSGNPERLNSISADFTGISRSQLLSFGEWLFEELVRYYGLALPVPVYLSGNPERLNSISADFTGISRSQLLSFGEWLFEEEFLEAIPIQTPYISGVAYVLPYRTASSAKGKHRIYLKQMLLTERGDTLLPPWAFLLQCFLNTRGLRPTASREDFYEDRALSDPGGEFAAAVRRHLAQLADEALFPFKYQAKLHRFLPAGLPVCTP